MLSGPMLLASPEKINVYVSDASSLEHHGVGYIAGPLLDMDLRFMAQSWSQRYHFDGMSKASHSV